MVLQGKYSIKEIAEEIDGISDIDMPFDTRIKRVEDPLDHLQTGDSRGKASWSFRLSISGSKLLQSRSSPNSHFQ